jgi:orotidine-5'-phosphate decarboxylase
VTAPLIVALDYASATPALDLAHRLSPSLCRLKVGNELFTRSGPALIERLHLLGFEVFLDLKFHDIPNTVAGGIRAAADLGVWMVNVHASGGRRMMAAAAESIAGRAQRPLLIGVTILTSLTEQDLLEVGCGESPEQQAVRLAVLAADSGLDGVVCSALEVNALRRACGDKFCLVTPGIRLEHDDSGDQRRIMTPAAALAAGSDYLVVGRSITCADDPLAALQRVREEMLLPA